LETREIFRFGAGTGEIFRFDDETKKGSLFMRREAEFTDGTFAAAVWRRQGNGRLINDAGFFRPGGGIFFLGAGLRATAPLAKAATASDDRGAATSVA
jgi:hypothetical protein